MSNNISVDVINYEVIILFHQFTIAKKSVWLNAVKYQFMFLNGIYEACWVWYSKKIRFFVTKTAECINYNTQNIFMANYELVN